VRGLVSSYINTISCDFVVNHINATEIYRSNIITTLENSNIRGNPIENIIFPESYFYCFTYSCTNFLQASKYYASKYYTYSCHQTLSMSV
jgi:hypothetical protein